METNKPTWGRSEIIGAFSGVVVGGVGSVALISPGSNKYRAVVNPLMDDVEELQGATQMVSQANPQNAQSIDKLTSPLIIDKNHQIQEIKADTPFYYESDGAVVGGVGGSVLIGAALFAAGTFKFRRLLHARRNRPTELAVEQAID